MQRWCGLVSAREDAVAMAAANAHCRPGTPVAAWESSARGLSFWRMALALQVGLNVKFQCRRWGHGGYRHLISAITLPPTGPSTPVPWAIRRGRRCAAKFLVLLCNQRPFSACGQALILVVLSRAARLDEQSPGATGKIIAALTLRAQMELGHCCAYPDRRPVRQISSVSVLSRSNVKPSVPHRIVLSRT